MYSNKEWHALVDLAERMGGVLREVIGVPGELSVSSETVIAIGKDAVGPAELYAHLTGRDYRLAKDVEHLGKPPPRVVVTTMPFLSDSLMDALCPSANAAQPTVPGILCAATLEALRLRVLYTAALSLFNGVGPTESIDLRPIELAPIKRAPAPKLYDNETPSVEMRRMLAADAALLMINTHSDGVDAFLGPDLTLCSLLEKPLREGEGNGPYCRESGICHRHGVSVATAREYLVDPAEITARVLIWSACYGVLAQHSIYDAMPGLLGSFLQADGIGAVIATRGVSFSLRDQLDGLYHDLSQGMPFGEAVARLNRSQSAIDSGVRFYLFGEPGAYLPNLPHVSDRPGDRLLDMPPANEKDYLELAFLKAYLSACVLNLPQGLDHYLRLAIEAVQLYEYQYWLGAPVDGDQGVQGDILRKNVLDFLMRRGSGIFHVWLAFSVTMHSEEGQSCPGCGRTTTVTQVDLRIPGVSARRLVRCVRCGVVRDAPIWSDLALKIDGERFLLCGRRPKRDWAACLHLGCQNEMESTAWEWPALGDGSLAETFKPPQPWPKGPLRIAFMLLEGTAVHVVSLPGRNDFRAAL
ncbi:MAG: hypothetical protein KZQ88_18395 [Candidatus Thiodiazotropha sp. (ex Dulcina madagascariensis)]|nr:hypothetical protein [Candidatus Thiodiazotropha sp. (ex Dulcina madagascariensis)]MCU7929024.1 hypothetical protein [Candidatus Thiodiazotropha sp. (ex Dulcina madagascariensis)]